jgi:acetoin utilization deacetylase AcuC-like enzyme
MTESKKKMFIHCPELEEFPYPDTCPFKTSRAGEVYKTLESMGLLTGADKVVLPPEKATDEDLLKFHSLMQLGTGDCPAFEGVYQYALWAAGATITAARQIIEGNAAVAFNPHSTAWQGASVISMT